MLLCCVMVRFLFVKDYVGYCTKAGLRDARQGEASQGALQVPRGGGQARGVAVGGGGVRGVRS